MAEANTNSLAQKRYAVVTGSNKGIGFEICKQLASKGVTVVVTARDEKKGVEAMEKLNDLGLSEHVVFHQLDVTKPSSISSLVDFIQAQFGVLDILVNNAAILGDSVDWHAIEASVRKAIKEESSTSKFDTIIKHSDGTPDECLETNYYGAKRMVEAFIPLLQLSHSPRIVNVSSTAGLLKVLQTFLAYMRLNIPSEEVRGVLSNAESLTEEKVDELLSDFLKDFKQGSSQTKGWPTFLPAYTMSKAAMNAYTIILAKRYPSFRINCVNPGYVKTDINDNTGLYTVEEGAQGPVRLALLPDDGSSGLYFDRNEVSSY